MLLALALVELLVQAVRGFPRCRPRAQLFRQRTASCCRRSALTLLVGIAQRPLSGLLPVPLPAGAGAQGQPLGGRNSGLGPASRGARRASVRGVDRAHHLHRGDLRPDRLRAHGRPGIQARPHPSGRGTWAAPSCSAKVEMIVEQMKRVPGVVAVGLTDIGVATDNNSNTGVIPPGSNQAGRHRPL